MKIRRGFGEVKWQRSYAVPYFSRSSDIFFSQSGQMPCVSSAGPALEAFTFCARHDPDAVRVFPHHMQTAMNLRESRPRISPLSIGKN
jgi:hypothetical protein